MFLFVDVQQADANTERLRTAVEDAGGEWREVSQLSELQLAELVRTDRIDILVELTGHTANNRLGVMALKPAPIQVPKRAASGLVETSRPEGEFPALNAPA